MDWVYSETVKAHFMHPKNVLQEGEIFEENGRGLTGNIKCGDEMLMLIRVDPATETILDCRWKTYGCASAIASTSILSEMIKGMTLEEAFRITPQAILERLGGLPEHKIHCSVLGDKALRAAINDYYRRAGKFEKVREEAAKVVCQCMQVTDQEIEHAVLEGVRSYAALQEHTKLGTVCGQCQKEAMRLLASYLHQHFGIEMERADE